MASEVLATDWLPLGAMLLVHAALIAALMHQRRRRRQAETQVVRQGADLQVSHDRLRQMGGRLVTAVEDERSRIARELHDGLAQEIVLLRMALQHAGTDLQTLARVDGIAQGVRDLSRRLHPARFQLGLVTCLRNLQQEHSRVGLPVSFTHGDVPTGLVPAITLCLTRVAQEALQNAVKHSQARHVSIDLRHKATSLVMTIIDDGRGFVVDGAWGNGLGLIGIRERVEANGGTAVIESRLGVGTRVDVTVPLAMELSRASASPHAPSANVISAVGQEHRDSDGWVSGRRAAL